MSAVLCRKMHPASWSVDPGDEPVGLLRFQWYEMRDRGWQGGGDYNLLLGAYRTLRSLLPTVFRNERTWSFIGPRWTTRACREDEEWCLWDITHDTFSNPSPWKHRWHIRGPHKQ